MINDKDPEILWNGKWTPICGHYFWDNNNGAKLFCKKRGFENGVVKNTRSRLTNDAIRIGKCLDSDTNLENCSGGCNDLLVGDRCVDNYWARCRKGNRAKISIDCF